MFNSETYPLLHRQIHIQTPYIKHFQTFQTDISMIKINLILIEKHLDLCCFFRTKPQNEHFSWQVTLNLIFI